MGVKCEEGKEREKEARKRCTMASIIEKRKTDRQRDRMRGRLARLPIAVSLRIS